MFVPFSGGRLLELLQFCRSEDLPSSLCARFPKEQIHALYIQFTFLMHFSPMDVLVTHVTHRFLDCPGRQIQQAWAADGLLQSESGAASARHNSILLLLYGGV